MSKKGPTKPTQEQLAGLEAFRTESYNRNRCRRVHRVHQLTPNAVKVLEHLKNSRGNTVTNVEAIVVLKVMSVSRRITELQDAGFDIEKTHKRDTSGTRYVQYKLVG
jgi:predicted transcriptional regulator